MLRYMQGESTLEGVRKYLDLTLSQAAAILDAQPMSAPIGQLTVEDETPVLARPLLLPVVEALVDPACKADVLPMILQDGLSGGHIAFLTQGFTLGPTCLPWATKDPAQAMELLRAAHIIPPGEFFLPELNLSFNVKCACTTCGGSGFNGHGTGYDDVCDDCAGCPVWEEPSDAPGQVRDVAAWASIGWEQLVQTVYHGVAALTLAVTLPRWREFKGLPEEGLDFRWKMEWWPNPTEIVTISEPSPNPWVVRRLPTVICLPTSPLVTP